METHQAKNEFQPAVEVEIKVGVEVIVEVEVGVEVVVEVVLGV